MPDPLEKIVRTAGLNLVIPDKADPERDRVADSWCAHGGTVTRIGRFWDPPTLDRRAVRLYANDTFALVLAQKLNLHLVSPDDTLLVQLPAGLVGRRVRATTLGDARHFTFPTFVKPIVPKQFRAGVYASWPQLETECFGLDMEVPVYEKEYARLLRKVGFEELWPRMAASAPAGNKYAMRYFAYFRAIQERSAAVIPNRHSS